MKLSMWMIANRLSPLLDIKTKIRSDAPAILNSARLVYSTNCVHVFQDGDSVIYESNGDRIQLPGFTIKEAFEILQGIFDAFQDWENDINEALQQKDFQAVIDQSWLILQNPLILMDANNHVLALTKQSLVGEMDEEWDYLAHYGYTSLKSLQLMQYDNKKIDFQHPGCQIYRFKANQQMKYNGASYNLHFNDTPCGRLTVLEKNRPLNAGDFQILEKLAGFLQPILGISVENKPSAYNAFYSLIFRKPYEQTELENQMNYHQWKAKDTYQIVLLQPCDIQNHSIILHLLSQSLHNQIPNAVILTHDPYVICLDNRDLYHDDLFRNMLTILCGTSPVKIGFSLTAIGLKHASFMLQQAVTAIKYGMHFAPEETFYHFGEYSLYFILETSYLADKLQACHPAVRKLWQKKNEQNDELFDTLKVYLDCERSLHKAAAELCTHRNTVLYRIKKCQELLNDDLQNAQSRLYIRISMYILEITRDAAAHADRPVLSSIHEPAEKQHA